MGDTRPLIFQGKKIGGIRIDEVTGAVTGQVDPDALSALDKIDLCWKAIDTSIHIEVKENDGQVQTRPARHDR